MQGNPTTTQVVLLILNYTACLPVLIAVGIFSLLQFWSLFTNTTTIESWEKDRAASLKRRGKIREVSPRRSAYQDAAGATNADVCSFCLSRRCELTSLSFSCSRYSTNTPTTSPTSRTSSRCSERTRSSGAGRNRRRETDWHTQSRKAQVRPSVYPASIVPPSHDRQRAAADAKDQLAWPPRDEFQSYSRKRARPLPPPEEAFTYGNDLNPALLHHREAGVTQIGQAGLEEAEDAVDSGLRRRQVLAGAARRPPYQEQDDESEGSSSYDETTSEEDEEDDVPLGTLAARRARAAAASGGGVAAEEEAAADEEEEEDLDPERVVRIRRGSEGYEIRPRLADPSFQDRTPASRDDTSTDDEGWERVEQEGELPTEASRPQATEDSLRRRPSRVLYVEGD